MVITVQAWKVIYQPKLVTINSEVSPRYHKIYSSGARIAGTPLTLDT